MKSKMVYLLIIVLLVLAIMIMSSYIEYQETTIEETLVKPSEVKEAKLIIKSLDIEYCGYESTIDKVRVEFKDITLKNTGNASFGSRHGDPQKIVIEVAIKGQNKSISDYAYIKPNETWSPKYLEDLYLVVKRQPGEYKLNGTLCIKDESGKIMDSRNFSVSIPTAKMGDTILLNPRVLARDGTPKRFNMILNSWHVEPNKLSPEKFKDVVINVTIRNSYHKMSVETPQIFASVMTDKGYVEYGDLSPLSFVELYPEEEITGEIRVTIPLNWNPVEMHICYTDEIILLSEPPLTSSMTMSREVK